MKKLGIYLLTISICLMFPTFCFAENSSFVANYSDEQLYKLAQNGILINNENICVRPIKNNELSLSTQDGSVQVDTSNFFIIERSFGESASYATQNSLISEKNIRYSVIGTLIIDNLDESDSINGRIESGAGDAITIKNIFDTRVKTIVKYGEQYEIHKPLTFGGQVISVDSGFSVQKFVCKAKGTGDSCDSSGNIINSFTDWSQTFTVNSGNLFTSRTTTANFNNYFRRTTANLGNHMTVYWKRTTGTTLNSFIVRYNIMEYLQG